MTYEELYRLVFEGNTKDENDTTLEHLARTILEKQYNGITDTREAVMQALELMPEMCGQDIDPTPDELSDIVYYVENPRYIRVRRGLIKSMKARNLCDYIAKEYSAFSKQELAYIIAEIDVAIYEYDIMPDKREYSEVMENAAEEIKERLYMK